MTGQDGAYLSRFLLEKKYLVYGYTRSIKKKNLKNLKILGISNKIKLRKYLEFKPDIILNDIMRLKPNEIYFFQDNPQYIDRIKYRSKLMRAILIFFLKY